jgi:hypothetical protein
MSLKNDFTQFIPYEQALPLKELGFDQPCLFSYNIWNTEKLNDAYYNNINHNSITDLVSAPLYQQAFQFLLDQLKIVSITYFNDGSGNLKLIGDGIFFDFNNRKECLIELINLVKLKK